MERETPSLPIEEPDRNSEQGMPLREAHHEQDDRVTSSEAEQWHDLNQHLANLGVKIAFHVVLEPDAEGAVPFKRMKKWVVVEQEQRISDAESV